MTLAFSSRLPTAKSRVLQQIIHVGWFYGRQSVILSFSEYVWFPLSFEFLILSFIYPGLYAMLAIEGSFRN